MGQQAGAVELLPAVPFLSALFFFIEYAASNMQLRNPSYNIIIRTGIRRRSSEGEEVSVWPVSYTHLDVYKRQEQVREDFKKETGSGGYRSLLPGDAAPGDF